MVTCNEILDEARDRLDGEAAEIFIGYDRALLARECSGLDLDDAAQREQAIQRVVDVCQASEVSTLPGDSEARR